MKKALINLREKDFKDELLQVLQQILLDYGIKIPKVDEQVDE